MNLFRVNPDNPFQGPHQGQPVSRRGTEPQQAHAAIILVHGRGATAQSMLAFAGELKGNLHFSALQAARQTWYPQSFLAPTEVNEPGISSGLQAIYDEIEVINQAGMSTARIILLGFSQGACLTLEFAARHPRRFGAVIGLSGGLIGPRIDPANYIGSLERTPVFLGCSSNDPHIPEQRVHDTAGILKKLNAEAITKIYPDMGHTVNMDEIAHIRALADGIDGIAR